MDNWESIKETRRKGRAYLDCLYERLKAAESGDERARLKQIIRHVKIAKKAYRELYGLPEQVE